MKKENTLHRIKQFIDYKRLTNKEFEQNVGFSNGAFASQLKNNRTIGVDKLENILFVYPEINPEWLLTGKGKMLKTDTQPILIESEQGLPLIPIDAMAGFGAGSQQIMEYDAKRYKVPEFTELNAEFMIRVKGSSMYPKYNSGDLLACKKISSSFFQWNKVYVLDTEQGALIKRIKPSDKENHIQCVSDNKNYDPFDLHIDEINAIAIVLGVIRLE